MVAEAKLDDFERAWGQCRTAMLAAQKLNPTPDLPIYGIATNDNTWQIGRLLGRELTVDPNTVALRTLDALNQQLHAVFRAVHALAISHTRTPVA